MTHQLPTHSIYLPIDAGRQIAQLRHISTLVKEIAGRRPPESGSDAALDENARIASAYSEALPIVQRRFDALARETAWSAAAVEALLAAGEQRSKAAARQLAHELQKALGELAKLLRL